MSLELHQIPPAPRRVRWRAAATQRRPALLVGLMLGVYGGIWCLLMALASDSGLARADAALDQAGIRVSSEILATQPVSGRIADADVDLVRFRHPDPSGRPLVARCFAPRGGHRPGETAETELLPYPPYRARLVGGRLSMVADRVGPTIALTLLPGILLLLYWLHGALRMRRLLASGDVACAERMDLEHPRFALPSTLAVRFEFRDRHARPREGHDQVAARSPLGRRLRDGENRLPVIHDRERPEHHRLVLASDFAPTTSEPSELPTTAKRG